MADSARGNPYFAHQPRLGAGLVRRLVRRVRRDMYETVMSQIPIGPETRVLEVGITAARINESNYFSRHYPHPARLIACGMELAPQLRSERPGLRLICADGRKLPFPDGAFDLAVSFAVIEHVGSRAEQARFVSELLRVAGECIIAFPNRWHPVEFHTLLPLAHWLPAGAFRKILQLCGRGFYAEEANLNLLGRNDFVGLLPAQGRDLDLKVFRYRLFGWTSNFLFYLRRKDSCAG